MGHGDASHPQRHGWKYGWAFCVNASFQQNPERQLLYQKCVRALLRELAQAWKQTASRILESQMDPQRQDDKALCDISRLAHAAALHRRDGMVCARASLAY